MIEERNHGYGDSPKVDGQPVILSDIKEPCPNCGGKTMFMIEVDLEEDPRFKILGGDGTPIGVYAGCAACPYASPMMTRRK